MTQRRMLAAGLGAVVLIAAGCGEGQVVPDRGQLAVAAAATTDARTARTEMTMTSVMPPIGEYSMTMSGVVDFAGEAARYTMTMEDMPGVGTVSGEFIAIDGAVYTGGMMAQQTMPDLDEGMWVRQPMPEVAGFGDQLGSQPTGMVEILRELGQPVEVVGADRVRDVETTQYRVHATGEEIQRAQQAQLDEQPFEMPAEMMDITVVIEVWVDDADLLRRMRMDMDMTEIVEQMRGQMGDQMADLEGEARTIITMDLFDFGIDVDVSAPPDDQVVDYEPPAFPPGEPDVGLGGTGMDMASESVAVDVDISVPQRVETEPGMLEGFPEEFPIHPAAWVMSSEQTPTGHEVVLRVTAWDQDEVDRVVTDHERSLEGHGWTITDRRSGDGREVFEIAGHGWTGTVTLRAHLDQSEIIIGVTLDRDGS